MNEQPVVRSGHVLLVLVLIVSLALGACAAPSQSEPQVSGESGITEESDGSAPAVRRYSGHCAANRCRGIRPESRNDVSR